MPSLFNPRRVAALIATVLLGCTLSMGAVGAAHAKADKAAAKSAKAEKSAKPAKSAKADKADKSDKTAKSSKAAAAGKHASAKHRAADEDEAPSRKGRATAKKHRDDAEEAPARKGRAVAKKRIADDDEDLPVKKGRASKTALTKAHLTKAQLAQQKAEEAAQERRLARARLSDRIAEQRAAVRGKPGAAVAVAAVGAGAGLSIKQRIAQARQEAAEREAERQSERQARDEERQARDERAQALAEERRAAAQERRAAMEEARQAALSAARARALMSPSERVTALASPTTRLSLGTQAGLHNTSDPLELKSNVALVIDEDTHEVLLSKNEQAVLPIASITKLMTGLVVAESRLPMDELITITDDDVDTLKGSRSRLNVGTTLSRGELMHLALMSSENRAAHALGRTFPGGMSRFVAMMNARAKSLGMHDTQYVEPTGLSSSNRSSARDLATLVSAAAQDSRMRALSTSTGTEVWTSSRNLQYGTTNGLVKNPEWQIGLQKTGYISEAGQCLVMQTRVAGRRLIMVFLDATGKYSREADAIRVRRWVESGGATASAASARQAAGSSVPLQTVKYTGG